MATETRLRQLADKGCPVYYFYSSERYLVRQAVAAATPHPDRRQRRGRHHSGWQLRRRSNSSSWRRAPFHFLVPGVWWCCRRSNPAAYSDKDLEELNSTLSSLENAVVVLGSVFELERSKLKAGQASTEADRAVQGALATPKNWLSPSPLN